MNITKFGEAYLRYITDKTANHSHETKNELNEFKETISGQGCKGSFQKKNDETYGKFHILGGGVSEGHFPYVITKDFKCTESHFEHF